MSTMALQMPCSYVDVDRDEMEYIDGGWFIPRFAAIAVLDTLAAAIGLGAMFYPIKYGARRLAEATIKSNVGKITNVIARFGGKDIVKGKNMCVGINEQF